MRNALLALVLAACGHPASSGPTSPPGSAGSDVGSGSGSATPTEAECDQAQCGPRMRMANTPCKDGSISGPTNRCLKKGDGCAWEVKACP